MLTVISPAKRLKWDTSPPKIPSSQPEFQADAASLARAAGRLSVDRLMKLMSISEDLARQSRSRSRAFLAAPGPDDARPAALVFAGDTYLGFEAGSLDADELTYAQDHLRIVSGLYGLLRPMDLIQPYRLEMGARLATRRGKTLYRFWGDRLARALCRAAEEIGAGAILNCASVEYFSALPRAALTLPAVEPRFLERRGDAMRIVSFYAKRARGAMARFVVQNRITDPAALKEFDLGGYVHQPQLSTHFGPVFVRSEEHGDRAGDSRSDGERIMV